MWTWEKKRRRKKEELMATAQILNNEAVIFEDNIYIKAKNF